jgi:hypothetical protein
VPGGLFDNVGDDPHRRTGWVDISIPNHEFFQNVVLIVPVSLSCGTPCSSTAMILAALKAIGSSQMRLEDV